MNLDDVERTLFVISALYDPATKLHSERTADYCVRLATHLNKDEAFIDDLRYAAIFHDIGKIGVDRYVLNKAGSLTDGEWVMMRMHTTFAEQVLRPMNVSEDIVQAVKAHHENYDGTGYPNGLKGDEIPIMARIIRIADTYDALRSSRPDRKAISKQQAIEVMWQYQSAFDPILLDEFTKMIDHE